MSLKLNVPHLFDLTKNVNNDECIVDILLSQYSLSPNGAPNGLNLDKSMPLFGSLAYINDDKKVPIFSLYGLPFFKMMKGESTVD